MLGLRINNWEINQSYFKFMELEERPFDKDVLIFIVVHSGLF